MKIERIQYELQTIEFERGRDKKRQDIFFFSQGIESTIQAAAGG